MGHAHRQLAGGPQQAFGAHELRRLAGALDGHAAAAANPRASSLVLVRERRAVRHAGRHAVRPPATFGGVQPPQDVPPDHQGDAQKVRIAGGPAGSRRCAGRASGRPGAGAGPPGGGPQDAPSVRGLRAQERLLLGGQPGGLERNQVAVLAQEPDGAQRASRSVASSLGDAAAPAPARPPASR